MKTDFQCIRRTPRSVAACLAALFVFAAMIGHAGAAEISGVGFRKLTFVDESRTIKPSGNFPGSDTRRLDVIVWYPTDNAATEAEENGELSASGPWPLIIYGHGTMGYPDNATHFVEHLVRQGYVVAAPTFPLTSRASFTKITLPEMSDTPNQPGDVRFVIDQLLAEDAFGSAIDSEKIGCVGHSLGAITCYFASFGLQTRDTRIVASALIGAGDPVQAALASDFGFDGVAHAHVSVPVLFLTAEKDIFAGLGGRPYAAYSRLEPPKYELMIQGGTHVWFRNGLEKPKDGKNPDCLFFEKNIPGMVVPGCEQRGGLTDPGLQQKITRDALAAFFNGYLKGAQSAIQELRGIGDRYKEANIIFQD